MYSQVESFADFIQVWDGFKNRLPRPYAVRIGNKINRRKEFVRQTIYDARKGDGTTLTFNKKQLLRSILVAAESVISEEQTKFSEKMKQLQSPVVGN